MFINELGRELRTTASFWLRFYKRDSMLKLLLAGSALLASASAARVSAACSAQETSATCVQIDVSSLSGISDGSDTSINWIKNSNDGTWTLAYKTLYPGANFGASNGDLTNEPPITVGSSFELPANFNFANLASLPARSGPPGSTANYLQRDAQFPDGGFYYSLLSNPPAGTAGEFESQFVTFRSLDAPPPLDTPDLCEGLPAGRCVVFNQLATTGDANGRVALLHWLRDPLTGTWTLEDSESSTSTVTGATYYAFGVGDDTLDPPRQSGNQANLPKEVPFAELSNNVPASSGDNFVRTTGDHPSASQDILSYGATYDSSAQFVKIFWHVLADGPRVEACRNITSSPQCLDHSAPVLGDPARPDLSSCYFSYQYGGCYSGASAPDACQAQFNRNDCVNAGTCFWDDVLGVCAASLSQINSAVTCGYYSGLVDQAGDNPGCGYHGCAYDSPSRVCSAAVNEGNTSATAVEQNVSTRVEFLNPRVADGSNTFTVDVVVPFVYSEDTKARPSWPQIAVLPSVSTGLQQFYELDDSPQCTTFQSANYGYPSQFASSVQPQVINDYLKQLTASTGSLAFDQTTNGQVLALALGYPNVGPNSIAKRVAYDGAKFNYTVSFDLTAVVAACSSARGGSEQTTSNGKRYVIPLAYLEASVFGLFSEVQTTFTIDVSLSGQVSIAATSTYRRLYAARFVSYPKTDCPDGSARLQITSRVAVRDVFDTTKSVTLDQVTTVPQAAYGPIGNCYGDTVVSVSDEFCAHPSCYSTVVTQSQCRVLTSDGQAFARCDRGPDADRIAQLGADVPYPPEYDGIHAIYAYTQLCDSGTTNNCVRIPASASVDKDQYRISVSGSSYLAQLSTANPFTVSGGFLPTSASPVGQFQFLSNTVPAGGQLSQARQFDRNLQSNQPVTLLALLPADLRNTYDLRILINPGNTTIYALDALGRGVGPSGPVTDDTQALSLTYSQMLRRLVFTVKNDYDFGCGAEQSCQLLPACAGILGCDGFSIAAQQLRTLLPANGYRFDLVYRIGLLNADGSPPNAGRGLLAMPQPKLSANELHLSAESFVPAATISAMRRRLLQQQPASSPSGSNEYQGRVYFTVRVDGNGTVSVEQSATGIAVDLYTQSQDLEYKYTRTQAFYMGPLTVTLSWLFLYPLVSVLAKRRADA